MTIDRDRLHALADEAGRGYVQLSGGMLAGLLDALTRAEAQSAIRGRDVAIYRERARKAEATIRRQERYIEELESVDAVGLKARAQRAEARIDAVLRLRDHLAAQEPTDAEVEAARTEVREALRDQYKDRYNLGRHDSINIGDEIDIDETSEMVARAALSAARNARRDEETRHDD